MNIQGFEKVISEIRQCFHSSNDALDKEFAIVKLLQRHCCDLVQYALEEMDNELMDTLTKQGCSVERKDERTIQFMFGCVKFKRRLFHRGENSFYALDWVLGIFPNKNYSPLFCEKAVTLTTQMPYRAAAEAIQSLTPIQITASSLWRLVQSTDGLLKELDDYEERKKHEVPPVKKAVKTLFIEGDGLDLFMQNKTRKTLHHFMIHEGVRDVTKTKRSCVNAKHFSDFSRKKAFEKTLSYIHDHYDLKESIVITNSDGGVGYKFPVFFELALGAKQHEHFVDMYHVNRKLLERMYFCKELIPKMKEAIHEWDKDKRKLVLDTMEAIALNEENEELACV